MTKLNKHSIEYIKYAEGFMTYKVIAKKLGVTRDGLHKFRLKNNMVKRRK